MAADRSSERLTKQLAVVRALRDGVSVEEGRRRNAQDRWAESDARLARLRCGTRAPASEQAQRPPQWWQRD